MVGGAGLTVVVEVAGVVLVIDVLLVRKTGVGVALLVLPTVDLTAEFD